METGLIHSLASTGQVDARVAYAMQRREARSVAESGTADVTDGMSDEERNVQLGPKMARMRAKK